MDKFLANKILAFFFCATLLMGCKPSTISTATQSAEQSNTNQIEQASAEQSYLALADEYFQEYLRLNPLEATYVGVHQYNNQFGKALSEEYLKQRHNLNDRYLKRVKAIDRSELPPNLQLSYDLFLYDRRIALNHETFPEQLLPINQFHSTIITIIQFGSGDSAQPFNTYQDYQNWLARLEGFIDWLALVQLRMDQGIASQVVLPKVLGEKLIPQLNAQINQAPTKSIFYHPVKNMPESFSAEQQQQISNQYRKIIVEEVQPAFKQLRDYLVNVYLPESRETDGWWALPNGKPWYQHLANYYTTTITPVDEIHALGLQEVERILSQMEKVKQQVGFPGDLQAFFALLSSDNKYFFTQRQELIDGYMALKNDINVRLPEYFNLIPKADYVVKPVEAFRESSAAGASYQAPAVDGSRPGIFYINTHNLKAQPKWGMTTLSLHEAAPGHHFQIAIKQELTNLPKFQRFSGYTAFEEGWALYAEELGIEMGLFKDPYQYFGKLSDEMLRAMRLVVDTGLHAKGWSREQAIEYMKDNSPLAESDIIAEVERYMAIPGQALSYKVGQLKILELRRRAEQVLGSKFDLKAFHDQVLTSGSLPMAVLEKKINNWISSQ